MSTHLQPIQQLVPGGDLSAYIQSVGRIPVLSAERERELAEDLFYHESVEAARRTDRQSAQRCGALDDARQAGTSHAHDGALHLDVIKNLFTDSL